MSRQFDSCYYANRVEFESKRYYCVGLRAYWLIIEWLPTPCNWLSVVNFFLGINKFSARFCPILSNSEIHYQYYTRLTQKYNFACCFVSCFIILACFYLLIEGAESYCWTWSRPKTHTNSVGLLCKRNLPLAETSTSQHNNTRKRGISMPPAGFEPAFPASERPENPRLRPCG